MKHFKVITVLSLLAHLNFYAQDYTWKKGDQFISQSTIYGTMGMSSSTNSPGSREAAVTWNDGSGGLWMLGGFGYDASSTFGLLNDLWKYDVILNEWTWMNGDSTRNMAGDYGTLGTTAPTNRPGAREGAASWVDAGGNLWLFGGIGLDDLGAQGILNDLWMYTPATNEWIWVNGGSLIGQSGTYGTQGLPSASTIPGGRYGSVVWTDPNGKVWLFGGFGFDASIPTPQYLNDLWTFDTNTFEWTWVTGDNTGNQYGVYGTAGVIDPANKPGSRWFARGWCDMSGNLWLHGGQGFPAAGNNGFLDDLWYYDRTSNQWAWMKGSSLINQPGTYGTQGQGNGNNTPGARIGHTSWTDASGNFWLFGGFGFANNTINNFLNDLWKFDYANYEWVWMKGSNITAQSGTYGIQGTAAPANTPGARYAASSWTDASSNLWLFGGNGFDDPGNSQFLNDLWKFGNCIATNLSLSTSRAKICKGETAKLSLNGALPFTSYNWSNNLHTPTISVNPSSTRSFTVVTTDIYDCSFSFSISVKVDPCTGISEITNSTASVLYPNPNSGEFTLEMNDQSNSATLMIFNSLGQNVSQQILNGGKNQIKVTLDKGLYMYEVAEEGKRIGSGKLLIE